MLGITEDEWVLLVKTVGIIKCIDDLTLLCEAGSRDYHPFQAIAEAVKSARSLRKLAISLDEEPVEPSSFHDKYEPRHPTARTLVWPAP
jgi:hypothetical protein